MHTTTTPFEILHTDVWGPSSVCSIDGFKYYLLIVDDYTKFTWIFPMTVKSEVSSIHSVYEQDGKIISKEDSKHAM